MLYYKCPQERGDKIQQLKEDKKMKKVNGEYVLSKTDIKRTCAHTREEDIIKNYFKEVERRAQSRAE